MGDGKAGKELGFELNKLWDAGKKALPTVANDYRDARNNVAYSGDGASTAFLRPAQFGGTHGAYGAWEGLREELEGILDQTAKSLELVGEALVLCANEYAKADQAAKDEFERLQREELGR